VSNERASLTEIYQFDVAEKNLSHNIPIDPKSFELK